MTVFYTLTNNKQYVVDDFSVENFKEEKGHLYRRANKKFKDLGFILYKEELNHDTRN